jgi:macrolide transport system ATP-binding/permease protein
MASFVRFLRKLWLLLERERFCDELNEEMEFHRAAVEKDLIDEGMTAEEARYAAKRQFGNATRLEEQSHEIIGFRAETVVQDLRFALRQLRRSPGSTLTAILILALGMGANLSIFAFVDAALLKRSRIVIRHGWWGCLGRLQRGRSTASPISTIWTGSD